MKKELNRRKFIVNATVTSASVIASFHGLSVSGSGTAGLRLQKPVNPLLLSDGLCNPSVTIRPYQLLSLVCVKGGADCPFMDKRKASEILSRISKDPTTTIRLETHVDELPRYTSLSDNNFASPDKEDVLNRKRDLEVLRRLGLTPGDTRRARYLFELLFSRIPSPRNICAFDTPGWEGCSLAASGSYEKVHEKGWSQIVYLRSDTERQEYRKRNTGSIDKDERIFVRPHHLMCFSCWYAGGKEHGPRPNDTLYEIWQRIRRDPDIPVTLVEGTCMACECCDGFHPANGRCVHSCGLVRDYLKDLTVFQKMGLMPGATLKGRDAFALLFDKVPSTHDVCGYGDGIVTSEEWKICGDPDGNPGYARTRVTGVF